MSDIRAEWIAMTERYRLSPERLDSEQFWCTRLYTASREELRDIRARNCVWRFALLMNTFRFTGESLML